MTLWKEVQGLTVCCGVLALTLCGGTVLGLAAASRGREIQHRAGTETPAVLPAEGHLLSLRHERPSRPARRPCPGLLETVPRSAGYGCHGRKRGLEKERHHPSPYDVCHALPDRGASEGHGGSWSSP